MKSSRKFVVDTNVILIANYSVQPDLRSDVCSTCISICVEAIENIMREGLIIDTAYEICGEYEKQMKKMKNQNNMIYRFLKWIFHHASDPRYICHVEITKNGNSYEEFPDHEKLNDFDPPDRKFIAVANAHPGKPPILQATDSRWWGCREAFEEVGISVCFLCPEYIQEKHKKKQRKSEK